MDDLVDQIYEAAFVPELWPTVLDRLSVVGNSAGGALLTTGSRFPPRWAASDIVAPALEASATTDAWRRNERSNRWASKHHPGFLRDVDMMSEAEVTNPEREGFATHGLGWQLGTVIPVPTGEVVVCSLERHRKDGPHDLQSLQAVDVYRPHIARAGLLAARLGLERARTAVTTLEALGLPAAVLAANGRVVSSNPLFETTPIFVARAHGAVALDDRVAQALLADGLENAGRVSCSLPVQGQEGAAPYIVHIVPLAGAANDVFAGGAVLVVATSVGQTRMPTEQALLQGLFDLTAAEAKLAGALQAGATLNQAAWTLGIRISTARTHLQSIFRKTRVAQQSQLVSLLATAVSIRPG